MSMLKKLAAGCLLSIFGVALGLIVLEAAFRLFASKPPAQWSDRPKFYFKAEAAPTMQDFAHTPEKPAGVFRVAVVGDSYSFAPFMQFTDAFPKKLEQLLNLNEAPLKAQVVNYGVPAYSTSHEVEVAKRALEERADLVILQITPNDPELKPYRPTGINLKLGDRFGLPETPEWAKPIFRYWRSAEYVYGRLGNSRSHRVYKDYFLNLYENPKSLAVFKRSLASIASQCTERSVPLMAVVFPLFGLPMDDRYPFYRIHETIDEILTELKVPHFDISEIYKGIPLERLQVWPGVDRHPNEIAHRMAAEEIYLWMEKKGFVPDPLRIRDRFKNRTQIVDEKRIVQEQEGVTGPASDAGPAAADPAARN